MSDNSSDGLWYAQEYLEAKYNNGEFKQIIEHLFDCLQDNRETIQGLIKEADASNKDGKLSVIKEYLKNRKSIHLPSEMAAQIQEISKELWIRGEEGEKNASKVKEEWAQEHAPSWRQARIIEMQFVVDKMSDKVIETVE